MPRKSQEIEIEPLTEALGAVIHGVDLSRGLDEETFQQLLAAHARYGVIFFRDQDLSPEQHIAFARRWGRINVNRFFKAVDQYPMIAEVRKEPMEKEALGAEWHTDHSYDSVPAMGSILYAREVPEVGGDTLFASMERAYEALSEGLRKTLCGLRAVHSSRHVFGKSRYERSGDLKGRIGNPEKATQDAVHRVVLRHPRTGRLGLYVNPVFTVRFEDWSEEESKPLLNFLYRHAARPEFTCRFRWAAGSLAFWDNLSTWHCAVNDYHGERRLMHRITIEGQPID